MSISSMVFQDFRSGVLIQGLRMKELRVLTALKYLLIQQQNSERFYHLGLGDHYSYCVNILEKYFCKILNQYIFVYFKEHKLKKELQVILFEETIINQYNRISFISMSDVNIIRKQIGQKYVSMCQKISHSPNNSLVRYLENPAAKSFYLDLVFRGNDKINFSNRLTDRDIILLTSALDGHQSIVRHVDFSFNQLSDVGIQIFAKCLESCSSIISLNLQGNSLGEASAQKIGSSLQNSQTLKYLNLQNNQIGTNGIISITKTLLFSSKQDKEKSLQQLNIANNGIDIDGVICVTSVLNWNNNSLKVLNLDNPTYQSIGQQCAVHFAKMLQVNRGLEKLSLRKNGLSCDAMFTIKNLVLQNNKLRVLDLSCNKIAFNGCQSLSQILTSKYCVLQSLNLSSNRVGHYGAKAIAQALSKNRTLIHLDLTRNDVDDNGLRMIAESLQTNDHLVSLKLYWNHFGQLSLRQFHKLAKRRENSQTFWDFKTYIVDNQIQMALVDHNIKYDIEVSKKYFV